MFGRFGRHVRATLVALAVILVATIAPAGGDAPAGQAAAHDHASRDEGRQDDLARVRRATARFHRVEEAIAAGYELGWVNGRGDRIITGCVSHPSRGAMGYHYFHPDLMDDLAVDPLEPEALVYAPTVDGGRKLVAVEWVIRGPNSSPPGPTPTEPPTVLGEEMQILVAPVGFYVAHAWLWRNNPEGMFAHWNPSVSCP